MANGGPEPTVSDAMIVAGLAKFGDVRLARAAMERLAPANELPTVIAEAVLAVAAEEICAAINRMVEERAAEPVYRVVDVIHGQRPEPRTIVGVGGAAAGLAPLVARRLSLDCVVPDGAMVANAIGAAVARPTMEVTLRADTAQGYYTVAELGIRETLTTRRFTLATAEELAARHLAARAATAGIPVTAVEMVTAEEFNLVRGFSTTGKIITCRLQIKPGAIPVRGRREYDGC